MSDVNTEASSGSSEVVRSETGLIEKNRQLLEEAKSAKAEAAAIRAALGGLDVSQIAQILAERKQAEEDRAKKAGEFDKLIEKRVNETKAEYEKRLAELAPYKTKYEDREVEIAIRDAAIKAGVIPDDLRIVTKLVKGDRIRLDDKTGKVVVLDEDGDISGLTVEKFFAEKFKAEAPKFYQGTVGSGGGASPASQSGRSTSGVIDRTDNAAFLANLDKIAQGKLKVA